MCEGENFEILTRMINEHGEYFLQKRDYIISLGFFPLIKKALFVGEKIAKEGEILFRLKTKDGEEAVEAVEIIKIF